LSLTAGGCPLTFIVAFVGKADEEWRFFLLPKEVSAGPGNGAHTLMAGRLLMVTTFFIGREVLNSFVSISEWLGPPNATQRNVPILEGKGG
jgi:hypothetical protein